MNKIKLFFETHGKINKFIVITLIAGMLLSFFGALIANEDIFIHHNNVIQTNHFIGDCVSLHKDNYALKILSAENIKEVEILKDDNTAESLKGNFISVKLSIIQNEQSELKEHLIDRNDFKLKDHTGVYLPLNDIMGAIGFDFVDVHIDETENGYFISSTDFQTVSCLEDYSYIDKEINKFDILELNIYFSVPENIDVKRDLIVLEVDLYITNFDYRKGEDIILIERKKFE